MDMVSEPVGYHLRTRRAEKQESCEKWEPRDTLYEAQQLMRGKDATACVVIWQEVSAKGEIKINARRAGPADTTARITMSKAAYYMGWGG